MRRGLLARPTVASRRFFTVYASSVAKTSALILLVLATAGCKVGEESSKTLSGTVLSRSDSLAVPYLIDVNGDRLAVLDQGMDRVLQIYDRETGRHLRSAMRRGDGPHEVRSPWSIHVRSGNTCVWDFSHSKSLCLVRKRRDRGRTPKFDQLTVADPTLRGESENVGLLDIAIASDSLLVGLSYTMPGRVAVVNYAEKRTLRFVRYDDLDEASPEVPRTVLLNGDLMMRPGTDKFVFAPRFGDEIYVGTLSGSVRRVESPVTVPTVPTSKGLGPERRAARHIGYINVDVTNEAIYGLFSGQPRGATRQEIEESMTSRKLHIYDWDTGRWRTRTLDTRAAAIAVDEPYLYTIVRETLPEIRVYRLREARRERALSGAGLDRTGESLRKRG